MAARSLSIVTTVVCPRDKAMAAIMMSFCPIGQPSVFNVSSKRALDSLVAVINAVLVQLLFSGIKIRRDVVGDFHRSHLRHRREHVGDLVGRHRTLIIGDIGTDGEDDLRTVGKVFGRGHLNSSFVDHSANGGHCFWPLSILDVAADNDVEIGPGQGVDRVITSVFASRLPSF
jgi:hypothetical protein